MANDQKVWQVNKYSKRSIMPNDRLPFSVHYLLYATIGYIMCAQGVWYNCMKPPQPPVHQWEYHIEQKVNVNEE